MNINWKAFARTGDLMVNEKCRDAVTDLYLILDSRDLARIGTVLKNPLEMGTVSAASLAAFFLKRRDSVALAIYDEKLSYLPPDTGDKQYFKILSALAGVRPQGAMPLQAVTNSLSGRFSRSPVFIISSCEGDGTAGRRSRPRRPRPRSHRALAVQLISNVGQPHPSHVL